MIEIDEKLLEGDWWLKGCAIKLLMYFVREVNISGVNAVSFNRRRIFSELGESEWSIRSALKQLVDLKIAIPKTTQSRYGTTVSLTGSYLKINKHTLPKSSQKGTKISSSSPKALPKSSQSLDNVSVCESGNNNDISNNVPPKALPKSSQNKREKETKKENFPHTPIKEINKEKEKDVLTDGCNFLSGDRKLLNKRAREVFEKFFYEKYGTTYYWSAKDAGNMTRLLNAIRFSRENRPKPLPTDVNSLINALQLFLSSITKKWINSNFSVSMISSHYNEIISELKLLQNATVTNSNEGAGNDQATIARRAEIANNLATYDEKWKRRKESTGNKDS